MTSPSANLVFCRNTERAVRNVALSIADEMSVGVIDPHVWLCVDVVPDDDSDTTRCPVVVGDILVYRDSHHPLQHIRRVVHANPLGRTRRLDSFAVKLVVRRHKRWGFAMSDSDMHWWSATETARRIAAKEVSSREVLEHMVARADRLDGSINSIVHRDLERARATADAADAAVMSGQDLGPFHGLPMTVKDSFQTEGCINYFRGT